MGILIKSYQLSNQAQLQLINLKQVSRQLKRIEKGLHLQKSWTQLF